MDVFAHGLWATAAAKTANKTAFRQKQDKKLSISWAAFWGVLPDVFAFAPLFAWLFWQKIFGDSAVQFPGPDAIEPAVGNSFFIFRLTPILYNVSHSLIIALAVIAVVWYWRKQRGSGISLVIFGWLLHIIIDVPTHSYKFYPTPFLWPLSDWKFDGFSWANPWFMIINYGAIIIVYLLLRRKQKLPGLKNNKIAV